MPIVAGAIRLVISNLIVFSIIEGGFSKALLREKMMKNEFKTP